MDSSDHSWRFRPTTSFASSNTLTVRDYLMSIMAKLDAKDPRPPVPLGHGDPSTFPCFRTTPVAEEAIVEAVRSGKFNCYCTSVGLPAAREALAEYLNQDLSHKLSPDDVFLTSGCIQAIEVMMSILASPGANILLPRPGFPFYEARSAVSGIEARHFDLLPDRNWEVDLDSVEALADENTAAIVVINPGNPCGNVFTYDHMAKIAETAKRLGILVISDEVYSHLAFGSNPFVSMGVFADIVPVISLGSISKRWVVPGWRLGWIAANDPKGIMKETKITETIKRYLSTSSDPPTFIQGAFPDILRKTKQDFFDNIICILKQTADICYSMLQEIGCIHCPHKPEGSMFVMVKLDLSLLDGISDDFDFCLKLSEEESVIILPGTAVGCKNWLRITFAIDPSSLEDGLTRLKSFCKRHEKQMM